MYACTGRYRISMGVTGMAIVRAIVGGEQDARQLAKLRDRRCHQVAPNSSTSRPGPPSLGAHTQCFLLPRSIPATLGRTTGNPSASSSLSRLLYYWFSHDSSTSCYPPSEHDSQVGRHSDSGLAFSRKAYVSAGRLVTATFNPAPPVAGLTSDSWLPSVRSAP